jgi:hypothetical protein
MTPDACLLDNMVLLSHPIPSSGFNGAVMTTHRGELKGFGALPGRLIKMAYYASRSTATLISLRYMNSLPGGFNLHSDSAGLLHLTDSGVEIGAYPRAGNNVWRIGIDPYLSEAHCLVSDLKAGPVANYAHTVVDAAALAPCLNVDFPAADTPPVLPQQATVPVLAVQGTVLP